MLASLINKQKAENKPYAIATPNVNCRGSTTIQLKSWHDGTKYNALRGRYAVQYADNMRNYNNHIRKLNPPRGKQKA